MSMDGTRFGAALALGVLLGLGVVAAAGGLGPSASVLEQGLLTARAATTSATSTAYTTNASAPTSISTGTKTAAGWNASMATASPPPTAGESALNSVVSPIPSSRFAAFASQSSGSDALLTIPILLAVVFGALLYIATARGKAGSERQ